MPRRSMRGKLWQRSTTLTGGLSKATFLIVPWQPSGDNDLCMTVYAYPCLPRCITSGNNPVFSPLN